MKDFEDELGVVIGAMHVASANLIGFHELAEGDPAPAPVDRLI